jgi:hypothetical protein
MSTLVWWCSSIFNIMAAVKSFSTRSIIKRYPRRIFAIQLALAIVLPASCVVAVFFTVSYKVDPLLLTICVPDKSYMAFYTLTLPSLVISVFAISMAILIIRRIKQVHTQTVVRPSTQRQARTRKRQSITKYFCFVSVLCSPVIHQIIQQQSHHCASSAQPSFPRPCCGCSSDFRNRLYHD